MRAVAVSCFGVCEPIRALEAPSLVTAVTSLRRMGQYALVLDSGMTISPFQTISEIASAALGAVRTFEKYGIDYCSGGKRPVADACLELGLDPSAVLAELEQAIRGAPTDLTDWSSVSLRELIRHILTTHHYYLKVELPQLRLRLQKVIRVYGAHDQERLGQLPDLLRGLTGELDMHMHKEELILFPFFERLEDAVQTGSPIPLSPFGSLANPIAMMESEHESAGATLREMRAATKDYEAPFHACITYRSMLDGLRELEQDLHLHIHLENNILFPRAMAMEALEPC